MINRLTVIALAFIASSAIFASEYLIKLETAEPASERNFIAHNGGTLELVSREGRIYKWTTSKSKTSLKLLRSQTWGSNVLHVEPNRPLKIMLSPALDENRDKLVEALGLLKKKKEKSENASTPYPDNPEIKKPTKQDQGNDPLLSQQWGMLSVDAAGAWKKTPGGKDIVVAVTDTGVDYNHQDLINNMWRNAKETPNDGVDNDNNGYVDDVVGWDFATNDNKPYDLTLSLMDIILQGGNPGHGTHVSGCIGASLNNKMGIVGLAPNVKIMALRFITEKGQGGTAEAIKAIDYAADNGAQIINASWGGESDGEQEEDKLLKETIDRAGKKGVLFLAAAGNGRANAQGGAAGFDIDNDPKPVYPAAYSLENVFTVAAVDSSNNLATFSNWGNKSVKLAAPGVKILSTVPGDKYQDTIINLGSITVTWDGTSMATPHVAGAAAAIWSTDKNMLARDVAKKLMDLATPTDAVNGKVVTNGRLDLHGLK
ncbi:MAG: protease [Proteobacteria bacterium]|nr:protease [Pseudomonadota bacterium]